MDMMAKQPTLRCTDNKLPMRGPGSVHIYLELGITAATDVKAFMEHSAPNLADCHPNRTFELIPATSIGLVRDYPTRERQADGTYCRSEPIGSEFKVLISKVVE